MVNIYNMDLWNNGADVDGQTLLYQETTGSHFLALIPAHQYLMWPLTEKEKKNMFAT